MYCHNTNAVPTTFHLNTPLYLLSLSQTFPRTFCFSACQDQQFKLCDTMCYNWQRQREKGTAPMTLKWNRCHNPDVTKDNSLCPLALFYPSHYIPTLTVSILLSAIFFSSMLISGTTVLYCCIALGNISCPIQPWLVWVKLELMALYCCLYKHGLWETSTFIYLFSFW